MEKRKFKRAGLPLCFAPDRRQFQAMSRTVHHTLDTQGLLCPEPLMLLHKAVREVESGQVIEVIATDPSTERDIPKFCTFLGHNLVFQARQGELYIYQIEKA